MDHVICSILGLNKVNFILRSVKGRYSFHAQQGIIMSVIILMLNITMLDIICCYFHDFISNKVCACC
jgi:hypothetical protein